MAKELSYTGFPLRLLDILWLKPCDTTSTTKDDGAVTRTLGSSITELVTLQTIIGEVGR